MDTIRRQGRGADSAHGKDVVQTRLTATWSMVSVNTSQILLRCARTILLHSILFDGTVPGWNLQSAEIVWKLIWATCVGDQCFNISGGLFTATKTQAFSRRETIQ